ncbi:YdcF family protein [Paenibacillus sp. YYML68]|uniref:YdcF family protein n=1 Tax=Paenibacillus sp. YYML68 TaxID=2909250 RepID=UPI0024939DDB|nr:YdcF family protein [Paenibacillus sp. YYML68]
MSRWVQAAAKTAIAALLLAAIWVGTVQLRMSLMPEQPLDKHDVAIVLGAALWHDKPSPALRERLNRAVELYEAGITSKLIVTGGYDRPDSVLTEAEGMRNYLVENGIPEEDIYLENLARSTYENLKYSRQIMDEQRWESAVIVTHRYHAVRALDIAQYLEYEQPKAAPMDSNVLMMSWHRGRETLALAKWQLDKIALAFGHEPVG